MREINKRELLKGIGTVGGSALTISGIGAAKRGQDDGPKPLDDDEIAELLRDARNRPTIVVVETIHTPLATTCPARRLLGALLRADVH